MSTNTPAGYSVNVSVNEEAHATEGDVSRAVEFEQHRVNEARKLGRITDADLGQQRLNSGEFTRSIREQLGVAEPVTPPPAAPGHSSTVQPTDYAGHVKRDYHLGPLSGATVTEMGELAVANGWAVEHGRGILQRIVDVSVQMKGMDTRAKANFVAAQETLATKMGGAEKAAAWKAAATAAMQKTELGRAVISSGLIADVHLQRMIADLAAAQAAWKK